MIVFLSHWIYAVQQTAIFIRSIPNVNKKAMIQSTRRKKLQIMVEDQGNKSITYDQIQPNPNLTG
jgi:hypothetical protein